MLPTFLFKIQSLVVATTCCKKDEDSNQGSSYEPINRTVTVSFDVTRKC